ncbi:uncharacterized protein PHACADRAFT_247267 [Phanerochaete carnosa HHB-10118-sp]|uniref:DH domain-containing protein n=1 Tax=Phanerochaete carnosa (strain HHB-10118-sp) TaxID=650164 RepID=K5VDD5_PHACS|nr:uncharacterized protein PHACADRAFT_247267 [Phanerochaete carnosa HHB-10118-sp]EKM60991.1 hypothetical protein PHACADRAFT_247267 [Phanerochaete carnosa HHB-10118-sp]
MPSRPELPIPANLLAAHDWHFSDESHEAPILPSTSEDDSFISEPSNAQFSTMSPKPPSLPDPSQYPDPYPFRPPRWNHGISTPTLSSADSSSGSTRSSAYTSSARSGDYGHVHVALGLDDSNTSMGISTDDVAKILARESTSSSSQRIRTPYAEESRWSDRYSQGVRSRSSSVGGRGEVASELGSPALRQEPSFDQGWVSVDERDEMGLTTDDETDDDGMIDEEDTPEDMEGEVTSAMMVAEEGRGIIVRGGEGPIVQLQVKLGTTHLLIGSSSTPNAVPAFLANVIPPISTTLLALDISANFLVALPPVLQACVCLEELNIASNPLRALPVFLAGLTSLQVLIADSTGISTLPAALSSLEKLHTLSIRRNKMNSLPSWLCLLPVLETLLVEGNPFQGPWKALVEPLLAKVPMSPLYPPSTPIFPVSPSIATIQSSASEDADDAAESSQQEKNLMQAVNEEEDTIMPTRAPLIARSVTSPTIGSQNAQVSLSLSRTRTTPNRAYFDKYRAPSKSVVGPQTGAPGSSSKENGERELRKMKSAGELRHGPGGSSKGLPASGSTSPQRPAVLHYTPSASSSNLLTTMSSHDGQEQPKRFASLGVSSALSPEGTRKRPAIDPTVWDGEPAEKGEPGAKVLPPLPVDVAPGAQPTMGSHLSKRDSRYNDESAARGKEETKSTRWGFLKKMSMGKMRSETPPVPRSSSANVRPRQPSTSRPSAILTEVDADGSLSLEVARSVANIFVSHAAFMRMYSTYINNFDNSLHRIKTWVSEKPNALANPLSPSSSTAQLVGLGITMSAVTTPGALPDSGPNNIVPLSSSQKKRIKAYLKRCRMNPRHSQLNLEGYLLLPVQRIPRYRLLLEDLLKSCPPIYDYVEDPLDRALSEISSLATNMNEGKRESESRRKLVQWQAKIRGKFPSPLVQPHRRLIMDGPLQLTRVVRKATVSFEVIDSKGDASTVQVECLSPELTPRSLIGILCNDLLVLCRDPSEGQDPNSQVDLWAVLRMQTLPQPASIVHGNALRLVDNKAILYFDAPSTSDALTWFRAINLHIPASKA